MPGALHKFSARKVSTEAEPGRHSDGGGLSLVVSPSGARKWLFLYRQAGKQREAGLGPVTGPSAVSLADARTKAAWCREVLSKGSDPIEVRRRQQAETDAPKVPTFGEFADRYVEAHRASWRNAKHADQ